MHLGTHHRSPSRVAMRLLLLLALAAASLTLTHCRMVGDRLTGVQVAPLARAGDCVKRCNDTYNAQKQAQRVLHAVLINNCGGDTACIAAENARYDQALDQIRRDRDACRDECHKQGGGGGD